MVAGIFLNILTSSVSPVSDQKAE